MRRVQREYQEVFGCFPNLMRPRRLSEKIQWRKLFDRNPLFAVLSDKIAVRDFIASRVGAEFLMPLFWVGDTPDEIPFDNLKPPYVLKCNHGSGMNVFVTEREDLDRGKIFEQLRQHLSRNLGLEICEPGYIPVRPRLLAERLLLEPDGSPPLEHKLFVFDGRVRVIQTVVVGRDRKRFAAVHDPDWSPLNWRIGHTPNYEGTLPRPTRLKELIAAAERLGVSFDFVRVDSYDWTGSIWIGELTLYQNRGLVRFQPDEVDLALGAWWCLPHPVRRALVSYFKP